MDIEISLKELNGLIERFEKQRAFIEANRTFLQAIEEAEGSSVIMWSDRPRVSFELGPDTSFKGLLVACRTAMRQLCGTWNDEFLFTWCPYGDKVIIAYQDKSHPVEMWIETTIENFPEELKASPSCQWKKSTYSTTTLVCEV